MYPSGWAGDFNSRLPMGMKSILGQIAEISGKAGLLLFRQDLCLRP